MKDDLKPTKKAKPTEAEENFRTPEEVAASDDIEEVDEIETSDEKEPAVTKSKTSPQGGWRRKLDLHWPPGRKEYLTAGGIVLLLLAFVGVSALIGNDKHTSVSLKSFRSKVRPVTAPSTLTGLQVDPKVNDRPVTAVMIENSPDARPQSGLSEAGVVFEAIAEGGITRFLALFQDTAPTNIGPVRSARPYYIQWELAFDAGYAHVGGSPEAIRDIRSWGVKDLDQFYNSGAYHRVTTRYAPHNVYTSIKALNQLEKSKGYSHSKYTGFVRQVLPKVLKPRSKTTTAVKPTAQTIDLALSGALYNVHYDYNAKSNSYDRSEGGVPHRDATGNKRISPSVVIALVTNYGIASDGHHSDYQVNGHGKVFVFQNGKVAIGKWTKTSDKSQITFTDAKGKTLELIPGKTWITAVSASSNVSYAPLK